MAPDSEVLKRKRSRPSDWWANASIIASTPQRTPVPPRTQDESEPGPAKKRGRPSTGKLVERVVQDAPAAANRGRHAKKRRVEGEVDDENGGEDELASSRRGPSSAAEVELDTITRSSKNTQEVQHKRTRKPAVGHENDVENASAEEPRPKKRGRPTAVQAEQQDEVSDEPAVEELVPKRRGRPSASRAKEATEPAPVAIKQRSRRGRQSDTEAEVRAAVEEVVPGDTELRKQQRRAIVGKATGHADVQQTEGQEGSRMPGRRPVLEQSAENLDKRPAEVDDVPKKRGRRPLEAATSGNSEELVVPVATSKRTGRSDADALHQGTTSATNDELERGRPRTRRSDVSTREQELNEPRVSSKEDRGRRRTRLSDVQSQPVPASSAMDTRQETGRKSNNRTQATTVDVEAASSKLTKAASGSRKVGRAAASKPSKEQDSNKTKNRSQPSSSSLQEHEASKSSRKASKRISEPEPPARKRKELENPENTPNKRQRLNKEHEHHATDIPEPEETEMLYQYLQQITRKVPRHIIDAKWNPVPPTCVERVSQFLQDIQRPVVVRLNDERKKIEATSVLQVVSRRLVKKISKGLPFPPATRNHREDDFDFEKILDHNRTLEVNLTSALHGNELLEAELAKETSWLEADKETLAELERNAKSEAVTRNQATRKLHVLLQPEESLLETEALRNNVGMKDHSQRIVPLDLQIQGDENLQGLVKGLHGHVDTILGNMKQVSGIAETIVRSKAAVQSTLFSHLSDMQYGEVILGSD